MYPESEGAAGLADHQRADPIPKVGKDPNNPSAIPTPHPTFPRLPDGPEALKSPAGKIRFLSQSPALLFASRIPADMICSLIMTQSLEGETALVSLSQSSGDAWAPAPCPGVRASHRPRPRGQASCAPARGPPSLRRPLSGLQTFPAPAPTPTRSFPVGASWARRRVRARGCPNSASPATGAGKGGEGRGSRLARERPSGKTQAPGAAGGRSGKPRSPARRRKTNWAADDPAPFPVLPARLRGCPGAVGLSRRCLPTQLPMLALQPGPMHRRRRADRLLRAPAPDGDVGSAAPCCPASDAHQSPPGRALPRHRLRHKLCGRGGEREVADSPAQSQVAGPGGPRRLPWRRPAPLERGAERGRAPAFSRLSSGLPTEAGPRNLSLHLLTPPQPSPAACRRLAVPAPPPPPPAPGAHVTDGTAPVGRAWFSSLVSQEDRPLGPTQPGARPAARLPGSRAGNYCLALNGPRLRARQPSFPEPPPRPQAPPLGRGPSPSTPGNCLAWSRQTRDPGNPAPQPSPAVARGGACAEDPALPRPLPLSRGLQFASWPPPRLWRRWRLWAPCVGLVQDFVMGQQEGPADQVAAGTADGALRFHFGTSRKRPQQRRLEGRR